MAWSCHKFQLTKVDGVAEGHDKGWRPNLAEFLAKQPGNLRVLHDLDVPTIVGIQKEMYLSSFLSDESHSSLSLYGCLQPDYKYAPYLSAVQSFGLRRLISRFRCGCHGLRIDTGRFGTDRLPKEDRVCAVLQELTIS